MTVNKRIKILLAEDDTDLCESLIDCLDLHGYSVRGVPNALSFYQAISADSFDIAIIDLGLPDQSGLEIVSHLKENKNMGIIILTAMGSPEIRAQGYESGADLYLVKPTECRELAAAIANLSNRLQKDLPQKSSPQSPLWTLNTSDLSLLSSSGKKVTLTVREATFLNILMRSPGDTIDRQIVAQALDINAGDLNDRRMDSMIRRLRKKTKETLGVNLPIHTVYGKGYVFSGRTVLR